MKSVTNVPSRSLLPQETSDLSRPSLVVEDGDLTICTEKSKHSRGHHEACGGVQSSLMRWEL